MRILHINCNYIGTTLHQLMVEQLGRMGYDNRVYCPTYDRGLAVIEPNENVIVSECFRKWDRVAFDYKQNKIMRDLEKRVDISSYDLIHAYTVFTDGNCARKMAKRYNLPYVVTVRNTDVNSFFAKMIHLRRRGIRIMRDAEAVFFLSEAYRKQVFEKYVPKKYREQLLAKSKIIPNGIDNFWHENEPEMQKTYTNGDTVELVYAGRIDKNKNIPTTQRAMDILKERGYKLHLTVVGKVQDRAQFDIIKSHAETTCLPPMAFTELKEVYRGAHLFVMPSFTESFGLVYAEAMSQGLPVIYSRGQGFDGQFAEGEVGFSVDSHSPRDVADGIERALASYDSLSSAVVAGSRRFNWSRIAEGYSEIYKKIGSM